MSVVDHGKGHRFSFNDEVTEESGVLKLVRMNAHWEFMGNVKQVMSAGVQGLKMITLQILEMYKQQGFSGYGWYLRGMRTVGTKGKKEVEAFVDEVNQNAKERLDQRKPMTVSANGNEVSLSELMETQKLKLKVLGVKASGNVVSALMDITLKSGNQTGFGFFSFDSGNRKLAQVKLYWETIPSD